MDKKHPGNPTIRRTEDLEAIRDLSIRAGLEVREGPLEKYVVCAFGCFVDDRLVGCATLEHKEGNYFVEWVAVENSMRSRGLGTSLVALVVEEARTRGARAIWVKARLPGFYEKVGFKKLEENETGPISVEECLDCPQYHKNCFPTVMVMQI